jgi:very-short-patch-repair endonuclease
MAQHLRLTEDQARVLIERINRVSGRAAGAAKIEAVGVQPKRGKRGGISELEHAFARQLTTLEIPPPLREYRFMENRDFRLDYCWPQKKLAVEVNGMVHRIKERFLRDTEKVAYALIHGWIVLPLSGDDVRSGRGVAWLVTLWESR